MKPILVNKKMYSATYNSGEISNIPNVDNPISINLEFYKDTEIAQLIQDLKDDIKKIENLISKSKIDNINAQKLSSLYAASSTNISAVTSLSIGNDIDYTKYANSLIEKTLDTLLSIANHINMLFIMNPISYEYQQNDQSIIIKSNQSQLIRQDYLNYHIIIHRYQLILP